jgi:GDP-6-deoxy-D-talose 4-dehydrogenase
VLDLRSDRILVTGSEGFTGRHLVARLRAIGARVYEMSRTPPEGSSGVFGDLSNGASLDRAVELVRPSVVVHLAGVSYPAHGNLAEIYGANVVGTVSLLSSIRKYSMPRLVVVASSASVYGSPDSLTPISEDFTLAPQSHYGVSKMAMERAARIFSTDMPILITRPFNYTGPGQSSEFLVPKLVDHFARKAEKIELGNTSLSRDFSSIGDVVEFYASLISSDAVPEVVNICSGVSVELSELVQMLGDIAGYEIEVIENRAFFREGEPRKIVGSTKLLDMITGEKRRLPIRSLLQDMFLARIEELRRI